MLTRLQFDRACKLFIQKYENSPPSMATNALRGWLWNDHPSISGLGYLSRNTNYLSRDTGSSVYMDSDDDYAEFDEAAAPIHINTESLMSQQYVVYSATFQVPCFYLTMYHSNGASLSINELLASTLFGPDILREADTTSFALTRRSTTFPLLSQGDHPTTGRPCWFLHPCETTAAVEELLKEVEMVENNEEEYLLRWLQVWFMVLGSVVNLAA
ncbi:hypothetical protein J3R30DRAFT_3587106 [Lentinula aciculospora]|uniref:Ubiquitin-like-conjugating enzyme ATG10 n=1 Tax=Lentinula aciculospora TaxID=153920 RepID=A0A9W9DEP7_9AGAR|nr:hypothetical protein J3R30DRAFT_3587106 [Lentinula aciculospora]